MNLRYFPYPPTPVDHPSPLTPPLLRGAELLKSPIAFLLPAPQLLANHFAPGNRTNKLAGNPQAATVPADGALQNLPLNGVHGGNTHRGKVTEGAEKRESKKRG